MTTANGVILCLVGLPGSGKTTFAKCLQQEVRTKQWTLVIVSYDGIIDANYTLPENCSDSWKNSRSVVVHCLYKALLKFLPMNDNDHSDTQGSDLFPRLCFGGGDTDIRRIKKSIQEKIDILVPPNRSSQRPILLLIDDNMYYRSMRYEYYKLARMFRMGFSTLMLDCPVAEAIRRNAARAPQDGRVPETVIRRMKERLEPPIQDGRYRWERHSAIVSSAMSLSNDKESAVPIRLGERSLAWAVIEAAYRDPVPVPRTLDPAQSAADREATLRSVVHQADLALRSHVKNLMGGGVRSTPSKDVLDIDPEVAGTSEGARLATVGPPATNSDSDAADRPRMEHSNRLAGQMMRKLDQADGAGHATEDTVNSADGSCFYGRISPGYNGSSALTTLETMDGLRARGTDNGVSEDITSLTSGSGLATDCGIAANSREHVKDLAMRLRAAKTELLREIRNGSVMPDLDGLRFELELRAGCCNV
jgi:L-seryl-tRNA(Sec) kinase